MRAVFLDRDGVINRYPGDFLYVTSLEEFHILPGVGEAIKRLNDHGFLVFVISNQAGVAKGICSRQTLELITGNMLEAIRIKGGLIQGVYYCTHREEEHCSCRKPKAGLVHLAISQMKKENEDIELKSSYFIGDTIRDIETGHSVGLNTILVFSGKEKPANCDTWKLKPDFTAEDLTKAVDMILKR
jgi:histidinol-phosphate phosphatase family protein